MINNQDNNQDSTDFETDIPTVMLSDSAGRSLLCYVEHTLNIDEQLYALLTPVHTPVNLFAWETEEEDEHPILVDDEEELEEVFPIAEAVLQERNLKLQWSAITLTVEGEIPELDEEEAEEETMEWSEADRNGSDHEEFRLLASFYHEEQEYSVYTPVDPPMILARLDQGKPRLLEPEEVERIAPILEARLAEELDL